MISWDEDSLIGAQKEDLEINKLRESVEGELHIKEDLNAAKFSIKDGILVRHFRLVLCHLGQIGE